MPISPPTDHESRLLNRELSWVEFNARVLELVADESLPLLERVKFCAIFSSNLDEFFMVRVAGLMGQETAGFAVRSARTRISLGPAMLSIATTPKTRRLAHAT